MITILNVYFCYNGLVTWEEVLEQHIFNTFRSWKKPNGTGENWWADLLFAQDLTGEMKAVGGAVTGREVEQKLCEAALADLELRQPRWAKTMLQRFVDGQMIENVASNFGVAKVTILKWQKWACADMAVFILEQEKILRGERAALLKNRLPSRMYSRLFGVENLTEQIIEQLTISDSGRILAVTGFGGIGKTALADAATRTIIEGLKFSEVVWIRYAPATMDGRSLSPGALFEEVMLQLAAHPKIDGQSRPRPERNRMVQAALKSTPFLVIVDNVEEPSDLEHLLAHLPRFKEPSRFLITSRARPSGGYTIPIIDVPPLSRPDSKALWRYEARRTNISGLADVEETYLDALFDRIGGNPLMIKVSVGLSTQFDLVDIITDLENHPTGVTAENYRRIYERAWSKLSDNGRLVLRSMALISEDGTGLNHLAGISRLDLSETRAAVQELTSRSLLEVRRNAEVSTYGIHRLTRTFIKTEVLRWRDNV